MHSTVPVSVSQELERHHHLAKIVLVGLCSSANYSISAVIAVCEVHAAVMLHNRRSAFCPYIITFTYTNQCWEFWLNY